MKPAEFPTTGYVRTYQIIGQKEVTEEQAAENKKQGKGIKKPRPGIPPFIAISKAKLWGDVKEGRFPAPSYVFGPKTPVWKAEDIIRFAEQAA